MHDQRAAIRHSDNDESCRFEIANGALESAPPRVFRINARRLFGLLPEDLKEFQNPNLSALPPKRLSRVRRFAGLRAALRFTLRFGALCFLPLFAALTARARARILDMTDRSVDDIFMLRL